METIVDTKQLRYTEEDFNMTRRRVKQTKQEPSKIQEELQETQEAPEVKQEEIKEPQKAVDPVIDLLSRLQFDHDVFAEIHAATKDPEMYDKFFRIPELFVMANANWVIRDNDPNKGNIDHAAFLNFIQWIAIKCATDPVWMCYFGWFFRFFAQHTDPSSYWPIKFSPRFLPKNFIVRGQPVSILNENNKIKSPEEVFGKAK